MTGSEPEKTARNRRTVEAYDAYARRYAEATASGRSASGFESLERFVAVIGPGSRVLEVGSGPGWDADTLEDLGQSVRRTDLSTGFIAVQAGRGKIVERLDLIADDLGGPWDGIVALYVIQHIERDLVPDVIGCIAAGLRPGGAVLFSFQTGTGEVVQQASDGGTYHIVRWLVPRMAALLRRQGLEVVWERSDEDEEGHWMTFIARRS